MAFQTFSGREYLKIDIANHYGLDKQTFYERIRWFDQNQHQLDNLVTTAEEPALFFAGKEAWYAVEDSQPIGYMISLDATSSGLQLLAALTGDRSAAELCNVVDTGNREDAYQGIYNRMLKHTGGTAKISKAMAKDAVMTSLYGSKAVPKKVFGEGQLLDVFYTTMKDVAPGAWELNEAFLAFWNPNALSHDWVLPDNYHVHIKVMNQVKEWATFLDSPYDVFYKVNEPLDEGRSLGANTIHSIDGMIVREMARRCDYDPKRIDRIGRWIAEGPKKSGWGVEDDSDDDRLVITLWDHYSQSGYLSARILDHLNPGNMGHVDVSQIKQLLDSLPAKPFKVVSIHDCFRCLPHYGNDLRQQYNLQLMMIAQSNLLAYLISQIIGQPVQVGKLDPLLYLDIATTNYALS